MPDSLLEFTVQGTPRSAQAKPWGRHRWVAKVSAAAAASRAEGASHFVEELSVVVIYFHYGETAIDVDNIAKPILDGLKGVVFVDDVLVTQILCRKTRLGTGLVVENASKQLAAGVDLNRDFVYVAIHGAPDHHRVP